MTADEVVKVLRSSYSTCIRNEHLFVEKFFSSEGDLWLIDLSIGHETTQVTLVKGTSCYDSRFVRSIPTKDLLEWVFNL